MTEPTSTRPLVLMWMEDDAAAAVVYEQLQQRYSFDYEIVRLASAAEMGAIDHGRVALVLADVLSEATPEILSSMKKASPSTRRAGIAPWGMPVAVRALQVLLQNGLAEWFVIQPQVLPDEQFHRGVSEFLEEWSRDNSAIFEIVRIVDAGSAKTHRLRDLLQRNNVTHGSYEPESEIGRQLIETYGLSARDLPAFVLFDGRILKDPTERELADAITGQTDVTATDVDVVVVGAGPAGLGAALYAASEGLTVAVLEREAIGGQAGTTSVIRNYLGFQRGITGQELAARAFRQAWGFGAHVLFIREAIGLGHDGERFSIEVSDGTALRGRSVVLAQGVAYRRMEIPSLEGLVGAGVYYGAAVTEAPSMRGKDVFVLGGGNSAGQAAVHLAKFASRVTVLVRGHSLAESMSDYLIEEMGRLPNVAIEFEREIVDGGGGNGLEWLEVHDHSTGDARRVEAAALFVLIGAVPATGWLPDEVVRDRWGFVLTDREVEDAGAWTLDRAPLPYETSAPGVFAVGDVRHGSVKRVASAVGEGSVSIQSVHRFLTGVPAAATV